MLKEKRKSTYNLWQMPVHCVCCKTLHEYGRRIFYAEKIEHPWLVVDIATESIYSTHLTYIGAMEAATGERFRRQHLTSTAL